MNLPIKPALIVILALTSPIYSFPWDNPQDLAAYNEALKKFNEDVYKKKKRGLTPEERAFRESQKAQISFAPVPGEDEIEFDRELMERLGHSWKKVEGYWADHPDPNIVSNENRKLPFPIAYAKPWKRQDAFLKKLLEIEEYARASLDAHERWVNEFLETHPDGRKKIAIRESVLPFMIHGCRGSSPCRMNPEEVVGSQEYLDRKSKISWPEGFSTHYVAKHNVKPSREFYRYVMNYQLPRQTMRTITLASLLLLLGGIFYLNPSLFAQNLSDWLTSKVS